MRKSTPTYSFARRMGAGAVLRDREAKRYTVSDWSEGTGQVFGRGPAGLYGLLPPDLQPALAFRLYKCGKCGTEKRIQTNHIEAVPGERCAGKCRTILNPHTEREIVQPYHGPHWYVRELKEGE